MQKIGNNDSCPCGSGKKFKKCCKFSKRTQRLKDVKVMSDKGKVNSLFSYRVTHINVESTQKKVDAHTDKIPDENG